MRAPYIKMRPMIRATLRSHARAIHSPAIRTTVVYRSYSARATSYLLPFRPRLRIYTRVCVYTYIHIYRRVLASELFIYVVGIARRALRFYDKFLSLSLFIFAPPFSRPTERLINGLCPCACVCSRACVCARYRLPLGFFIYNECCCRWRGSLDAAAAAAVAFS